MRRADRLFQLVQLLRSRRFATAQQLADELRVSKRTVYRDIRELAGSGVPIRGEAGVGYQLERGFELPPLTFNSDEVQALVLGARMVSVWGDPELASAARTALTKVEAALPEPLRKVFAATALYAPEQPRAETMAGELALMRRAIAEQRRLSFEYRRADGERSVRSVRPLALYIWGRQWTLAAWCELRLEYRSFRPDRMGRVLILDDAFDASDGICLEAFVSHTEAMERHSAPVAQVASP